jgi:hypothetical protein
MNVCTVRLWFVRAVMFYAFAINGFLAWLYIVEPQKHIAMFGVSVAGTSESLSFLRAGPGAMFIGLATTALYGLLRPKHFRTCLKVVVLFTACIVAARLYGILKDGATPMQLSELRDEGVSWLSFVAALVAYPSHNARQTSSNDGLREV